MPVLKNPRHERFCQELAKGKTADESYALAGFEPNRGNASRLKANESILRRVTELHERSAKRTEITIQSLTDELDQVLRMAFNSEKPQLSAAVAAIKEKGVLSGKRVERSEHGIPGEFADLANMSPDELREFIASDAEAESLREDEADEAGGVREAGEQLH